MKQIHYLLTIPILILSFNYAQITISVLDFQANGLPLNEVSILSDRFRAELIQLKEYSVIERATMEEVLKEQGFQQSGCVTNECVVEIGELLGAQQMVAGSIGKLGTAYTVTARIIDIQTGEIINATTYDYEGNIGGLLKIGMRRVAIDLFSKKDVAIVTAGLNMGEVFISTHPIGATIFIDEKKMGYSPLQIKKLTIGSHTIKATMPGYLSWSQVVMITSAQLDSINISLESIHSYQKKINNYKLIRSKLITTSILSTVSSIIFLAKANNNRYKTDNYKFDKSLGVLLLGTDLVSGILAYYYYLQEKEATAYIKYNS